MATLVSILGTLTALLCAVLLLRGWLIGRQRLLLWSALCFLGLAASNGMLVVDLRDPALDIHQLRLAVAALGMALLVFGLVWDTDRT